MKENNIILKREWYKKNIFFGVKNRIMVEVQLLYFSVLLYFRVKKYSNSVGDDLSLTTDLEYENQDACLWIIHLQTSNIMKKINNNV